MPIDYKRYPPNWKSEIVPAVIAHAGNCCEICGLANKSTVWSVAFRMQDDDGRYKQRKLWFSFYSDALRAANGEGIRIYPPVKVCLTIAHLDHDETNHEVQLDRLKAMCQMCHLRYDSKEKYRRLMNKSNNLFK